MIFNKTFDLGDITIRDDILNSFKDLLINDNASPYLVYTVANFAKDWFQSNIERLDVDHKYVRLSSVEGISENVKERAKNLYAAVFENQLNELESIKNEWRNAHPDYYRQQPCLISSKPISKAFYSSEALSYLAKELTLEEAIQGYKAASEALKSVPNEDLNPYCTEIRPMLNIEHKEEYELMVAEAKKSLEIPDETEWIAKLQLPVGTVVKKRLSLDRSSAISTKSWADAVTACIKSICE